MDVILYLDCDGVIFDTIDTAFKEMVDNNVSALMEGINSNIPILNLNAIIFGTRYKFNNDDFINTIKERFVDSNIKFFGTELKCFAIASLHLLNVQKYVGTDRTILRLIESNFYF